MMNWFKNLSKELKMWLGVGIGVLLATMATIIVGTVLRERDRNLERKTAQERTNNALSQLWDSLKVNRSERRAEHAVIIANQDTLKQLMRSFVWIMGLLTTGRICV